MNEQLLTTCRRWSGRIKAAAGLRASYLWTHIRWSRIRRSGNRDFRATQPDDGPAQSEPEMVISPRRQETLVVVLGGTTLEEYRRVGQFARLCSGLERYSLHFDRVLLLTADRHDFTGDLDLPKVRHVWTPRLVPGSPRLRLFASLLLRLKHLRTATAVLALDGHGAVFAWLVSKLSGSPVAGSFGAPWSPVQDRNSPSGRLTRFGLSRIERAVVWQWAGDLTLSEGVEEYRLPAHVDTELYCPLKNTDPDRPRVAVSFIYPDEAAEANTLMSVADRLERLRAGIGLKVALIGGAEGAVRAASLQAEAELRGVPVQFIPLPEPGLVPDVLARARIFIGIADKGPPPFLFEAMASGVPCIVARSESQLGEPVENWARFVIPCRAVDDEICRVVIALLREPGVRLRLGREGRRLAVAAYSINAAVWTEVQLLRAASPQAETPTAPGEEQYDADAEAEKLAGMLAAIGITRAETRSTGAEIESVAA